ncbi:Golgi-associated PDZ and coiled-coil motif-containing protein-like isoform X1 [Octopus sinensis]|uniref:Golgi-associated PDZ and coiled-coil motif-containing protein-like isoform X1 n=1 Tax=Octopus sinensis TaxID=2607531 RepID=A0A6P7TGR8_9MOLL|nr:Golgi-associated PDZ and coiled-coil motif-containing protein-like isoform X1 [Octopus sinensis]
MAANVSFRWLEILENDFDKAFVDLDLLLGEIDPEQYELTCDGRQKMTALSAAFAQLWHKAQTIFQYNVKLEVSIQFSCSGNYIYFNWWDKFSLFFFIIYSITNF